MPKDGKKSKKDKKEKKEDPAPDAGGDDGGDADQAEKTSRSKPAPKPGRAALGSPDFVAEVGRLRDSNLAKSTKKEDERKAAKQDLKQALETCIQLANKGLKMCNTGAASYLLEHLNADAEKLKIHIAQDEDYIEEVRFKHNKLHDLLDETRAFTPQQLQKDLVLNREIRTKCSQLIRGDTQPEVLVNQEELQELVKVRNSVRCWFGGKNMAKAIGSVKINDGEEKQLFSFSNSEIKVKSGKVI